jgi:hypothetical protein
MHTILNCAAMVVLMALAGCGDSGVYTLYRSSVSDTNARYHVASFDSADGDKYNNENCQIGKDVYQRQPGVIVRFWCEKGRYKQ